MFTSIRVLLKHTKPLAVLRKILLFQFDMELVKTVIWMEAVVDKEPNVMAKKVDVVVMTMLKEIVNLLLVMMKNSLHCKQILNAEERL